MERSSERLENSRRSLALKRRTARKMAIFCHSVLSAVLCGTELSTVGSVRNEVRYEAGEGIRKV